MTISCVVRSLLQLACCWWDSVGAGRYGTDRFILGAAAAATLAALGGCAQGEAVEADDSSLACVEVVVWGIFFLVFPARLAIAVSGHVGYHQVSYYFTFNVLGFVTVVLAFARVR